MAIVVRGIPVTVNIAGNEVYHTRAQLVQGDVGSNKFVITIQNYNEKVNLTNLTCDIQFKRPDETTITKRATITGLLTGTIEYTIQSSDTSVEGDYLACVVINGSNGEKLSTTIFTFKVRAKF